MEHRENYGILGTPLHYGGTGEAKLSAQNKIAPTPLAYAKLRQRGAVRGEKSLLEKTSVLATRKDSLYDDQGRSSDPKELMDEEDKAHLRIKGVIQRNRMQTEGLVPSEQSCALSFLAKSVDIPEIAMKQARTALGYGELERIYSFPSKGQENIGVKESPAVVYNASLYSPAELRCSKLGLGHRDEKEGNKGSWNSKGSRTFQTFREWKDVKAVRVATLTEYSSDEEDHMNDLANVGYKDLDSAAKVLSQRLQESRGQPTKNKSVHKRNPRNADDAFDDRGRFTEFSLSQSVYKPRHQWKEYKVPEQFAADPTHRFETDLMKKRLRDLAPHVQQEYAIRLKLHTHARKKETESSRFSMAKANEEQNARSRKIRDLAVKDMGSRFVESQKLHTQEAASGFPECTESKTRCDSSTLELPKRGETKRISQAWKPESLLCSRLGVESRKRTLNLKESSVKTPRRGTLLLSDGGDEEFLIHSITPGMAGTSDFSDEVVLAYGQVDAVDRQEDTDFAQIIDMSGSPSRQLAQAIFTNAKTIDGETEKQGRDMARDANLHGFSEAKEDNRGIHRTRAADFF